MEQKLVSVIIPVHNGEKFLERCIQSVMEQTYQTFEVLIIDNGSTDESYVIGKKMAERDERIRILTEAKKGAAVARNTGIRQMSGEYVCFLDVDDLWEPTFLEKLVALIEREQCDLASCNYKKYDKLLNEKEDKRLCRGLYDLSTQKRKLEFFLNSFLEIRLGFNIWNKIYKTQIIREYGLCFDERATVAEDMGFNMEYFCVASKVASTDEKLYRYFEYDFSTSDAERTGNLSLNDYTFVLQRLYARLVRDEKSDYLKKKFFLIFYKTMNIQYNMTSLVAVVEGIEKIQEIVFYKAQLRSVLTHPIIMIRVFGPRPAHLFLKRCYVQYRTLKRGK